MKDKYPVRGKIAYRTGLTLRAESAILDGGSGSLGALEKHLPGIFVRCVEEPSQSSVLGRIELPQIESPLLTREDPADEHNLDYVDEFELLAHQVLDTCLESGRLFRTTPLKALLFPGGEPYRGSGSDLGRCDPFGVTRLDDVEPPPLPPLYGLHKGALEP